MDVVVAVAVPLDGASPDSPPRQRHAAPAIRVRCASLVPAGVADKPRCVRAGTVQFGEASQVLPLATPTIAVAVDIARWSPVDIVATTLPESAVRQQTAANAASCASRQKQGP